MDTTRDARARRRMIGMGVLGVGLAGFIDGIVLHQILQWHHMLTDAGESATTVAGLEANTLADGLFHVGALVATLAGVVLLAGAAPPAGRRWPLRGMAGALLVGVGGFNLLEGVVDHHILTVHHVRDDVEDPLPWDLGFLAVNVVVLVAGLLLARGHGTAPAVRAEESRRDRAEAGAPR
jgi:uncharacterized membrane protein